tara:strand:+ start:75 stop:1940 length:1866 start_codon:yes stop_codon:yes gene_type:complete
MLKKLTLKAGVNRENTRYTNENGYYVSDKVRFRQGTPEKIGGWTRISANFFLGVCRSLWNWVTLGGANLLSVGTNLKFYIEFGGTYYDITPLRASSTINNNPFAGNGTTTVTVTDTAHGGVTGDFVTFSGATGTYATTWNQEYQITVLTVDTYTITVASAIPAGSYGGAAVVAAYQINVGPATALPVLGWGAGGWGTGGWGVGTSTSYPIRIWSQSNFGENLVFGYRGGEIYYWDNATGLSARGVLVSSLAGASDVPLMQNYLIVSDASRFVFAFGVNDYGSIVQNQMLLRWSDQEDIAMWTPAATNQAGSLLLSHGSKIVTALQARQEILVFTDSTLYSLQYQGPPVIWSSQLLGDNISIASQNAVAIGSGVVYWMGVDKFYKYDGRVQTLRCDLRKFIFEDINAEQSDQFFASTNEGFNEVWFFYCSASSSSINRYVVYNYFENNGEGVWYYGDMVRTAWLDSGLRNYPMAATDINNVVYHEYGVDDNSTEVSTAINAIIETSEFDIDDGHHFGFVWRMLPDITFSGSTGGSAPQVTMTLIPMQNAGSGYNDPISVGGNSNATIVRTATVPIEEFTGQVYIRVRGRQMILKIESSQLGTQWQLGSPRIDIRQDGRRGNS